VRRATLSVYPDGAAAKVNRAPLTYLEPAPAYEMIVAASGGYGERVERIEDLPGFEEAADRLLTEPGPHFVVVPITNSEPLPPVNHTDHATRVTSLRRALGVD